MWHLQISTWLNKPPLISRLVLLPYLFFLFYLFFVLSLSSMCKYCCVIENVVMCVVPLKAFEVGATFLSSDTYRQRKCLLTPSAGTQPPNVFCFYSCNGFLSGREAQQRQITSTLPLWCWFHVGQQFPFYTLSVVVLSPQTSQSKFHKPHLLVVTFSLWCLSTVHSSANTHRDIYNPAVTLGIFVYIIGQSVLCQLMCAATIRVGTALNKRKLYFYLTLWLTTIALTKPKLNSLVDN